MSFIALFGTIHRSYYTISVNFYLYLQYFQKRVFNFSKISGSQTDHSVGLVGGVGKVGGYKIFYFLFVLFGWEWKSRGMKKNNLNKFTHITLLKNDAQ